MTTSSSHSMRGRADPALDLFFAELGQGVNAYVERRLVLRELAQLAVQSDGELRSLGLRRERLLDHVLSRRYSC